MKYPIVQINEKSSRILIDQGEEINQGEEEREDDREGKDTGVIEKRVAKGFGHSDLFGVQSVSQPGQKFWSAIHPLIHNYF